MADGMMLSFPQLWLAWAACFLAGSIPSGFVVARARGVDIRKQGSGNIGATNVGRVLGRPWGILVFVIDFLKGAVPVAIFPAFAENPDARWPAIVAGLLCILGHNYTPWLGFKGGKGVATSAGVLAALMPAACAVVVGVWVIVTGITRYVSVGSIAASVALVGAVLFFYPGQPVLLIFSVAIAGLGIWRHRGNIVRLRAGTENKIGAK